MGRIQFYTALQAKLTNLGIFIAVRTSYLVQKQVNLVECGVLVCDFM
jgi:hypothetical protein